MSPSSNECGAIIHHFVLLRRSGAYRPRAMVNSAGPCAEFVRRQHRGDGYPRQAFETVKLMRRVLFRVQLLPLACLLRPEPAGEPRRPVFSEEENSS